MNSQPNGLTFMRRHGAVLLLMFFVALGIRISAVIAYRVEPVADAADYHRLATDLARGLGYVNTAGMPTAWQGDEAVVSAYFTRVAVDRLRNDHGHFFRLLPAKFISMAAPFDWEWFPHAQGRSRSWNIGYLLLLRLRHMALS